MVDPKIWYNLLKTWPSEMPHKGVVMTELNESIGFIGFAFDENMAIFQRQTPDALGARQAIIPFTSISYLKITTVVPPKVFTAFGFQGTLPKV